VVFPCRPLQDRQGSAYLACDRESGLQYRTEGCIMQVKAGWLGTVFQRICESGGAERIFPMEAPEQEEDTDDKNLWNADMPLLRLCA